VRSVFALYREVVSILPIQGRRFLWVYSWLLASLSVLDAAALGLLAVLIVPISAGQAASLPLIGRLDTAGVVIAIVVICALMIGKGLLSVLLIWWATRRISRYEVEIGDRLFRAYITAPWIERLRRNSSDMLRFSDSGVDTTVNAFLLPGATLLGEVVNLLVVIVALAIAQPVLAAVTLGYLLLLGAILFFWIAKRARTAGDINVDATVRTSRLILEIVAAMKEVALRNKESEVAGIVEASRTRSARARANIYFLGQFPRYALESGIIGGFIVVGGVGFLIGGIDHAITAVALFGLAGFRMAPAVTRLQSVVSQMISVSGYPRRVLEELHASELSVASTADRASRQLPAAPHVLRVEDATFRYAPDAPPAVENVTLEIPFGSTVAFVGESGSGKSTMVDLLLGLLEPSDGALSIDGIPLTELTRAWRSRVAYVPQDVALFDASIAQNVALTWSADYDAGRVQHALELAHLWTLVKGRPDGIESPIGERGLGLSGGQRQRLGIARALYSDPIVLVMDEATSALDTTTEAAVSESIAAISGNVTLILVAHRLATIKGADRIFFMQHGVLAGSGSFEELVERFPDFARQAQLAGLA